MVVASLLDGRVRVRDEGLKREPLVSRVRDALLATPGVSEVEANPRVGSFLILYSSAAAGIEKILKVITDFLGLPEQAGVEQPKTAAAGAEGAKGVFARLRLPPLAMPARLKSKAVNFGMLATLVLSVLAAVVHLKKLHVLAGILFLGFFGAHFFERKQFMFA